MIERRRLSLHSHSVNDRNRRRRTSSWLATTGGLAVAGTLLFEIGWSPPVWVSLSLFAAGFAATTFAFQLSRGSLLSRYFVALYALPFVHLMEYVFNDWDYFAGQGLIWGLAPNAYQRDPLTIERMAFIGAIGCLALVTGILVHSRRGEPSSSYVERRSLNLLGAAVLAVLALIFSWASAPTQTIFEAAYTTGVAPLEGVNFNASSIVAYVLCSFIFVDAAFETSRSLRLTKRLLGLASLSIILVWFQFLRGDRDSLGLVAAVAALFVVGPHAARLRQRKVKLVLAGSAFAFVAVAAQVVGAVRLDVENRMVSRTLDVAEIDLLHGTWSAVLLTPLSVVGDFERGLMDLRSGETYWQYVVSLPPGFVTQALGYERPIESTSGPAWDMRFGLGGTHLLVVPFMNFHAVGVLGIVFASGWLVGWIDRRSTRFSFPSLALYMLLFIAGPGWVWYGEMLLLRGFMAYLACLALYRLMLNKAPARTQQALTPAIRVV